MSRFFYEAVDGQGRRIPGVLECEDERKLAKILQEKGQTVIKCSTRPLTGVAKAKRSLGTGKVGASERATFASQMSRLLNSACPMDRALDLVSGVAQTVAMDSALRRVRADVQQGTSLNESLGRHPTVFHPLFLASVRAGEAGGFLAKAFLDLAEFESKQEKLRRKITGALIYPAFMILTVLLCLAVIMIFVVPSLVDFFAKSAMALPLPTVILIAVSNHSLAIFGGLFASLGLLAFLHGRFGQRPSVRRQLDDLTLSAPVVGRVARTVLLARFCRTMALLLDGGVELTRAIAITREAVTNVVYQLELDSICEQVTAGESLSHCMEVSPLFPDLLTGQVRFGEETGSLGAALKSLAEEYELQAESSLESLVGLLEPAVILVMGVVMGGIVVAIFLPMVSMLNFEK